jgi:predicted NBD/HSP70 family sugar kinase
MDKKVILSMNEIRKVEVILKVEGKQLTGKQAAERLRLSKRQVRSLIAKYRHRGAPGLVHGNRGCLEAYASGPAIAAMGLKAVVQGRTTIIGELVDFDLNKITPVTIAKAAAQGDEVAQNIIEEAGFYIGIATANVCAAIGPQKIVIAGGVSRIGEPLLAPIRRTVQERVRVMPVEQVEVVQAQLGNNAGVISVALWAANKFNILST